MRLPLSLCCLLLAAPSFAQDAPLRVTIRAGVKTHGPGQHDHPQFLADWKPLLEARGCTARGALEFPSEATLAETDVLVMYAAEGGSIHGEERAHLEAYLARGGGLVVLHDAVCGDDPQWFKTVVGGAWEHGHSKWHEGEIGLYFDDREHPITNGVVNFDFEDEIYWDLHLAPEAHVLASSFHTPFDVTPQMWVFEKDDYRAFVSLQGHEHESFSHPAWRTLLLRGIAWAGKRDANALVTADEVSALRYPPGGPSSPESASASFELHDDFEMELVAAEPLIVNPISIDWDARGRMWVALTPGYPYKQEFSGVRAHDEIAILDDTDGDGVMDTKTVFADGLDLVTSLVFHEDGVIVTQSPDILFLRDTDGDDRADERVKLFTGFGYGDTHATASNLRWGMDGFVYATQGYSGGASNHVTNAAGHDFGKIGNGIFRFRPDGSLIEQVVSYGSNTWGLDFTWDGELFFTMANGSHARHLVLEDGELAGDRFGDARSWQHIVDHSRAFPIQEYDRVPYQQIDFVGGFTAAAGCLIYSGGAWPAEFAGNHFVCEPTINLVHRDVITPKGATFEATKPREREFLASRDLWFRPVHVRTGPDGALYVLDFYNQAAVHNDTRGPQHGPTNAAVRPDRDRLHGRLWRVQHKDAKPAPLATLAGSTPTQLARALEHQNRWQRMTAQRLLRESRDEVALAPATPAAKIHALWLREQWRTLDAAAVTEALADESVEVVKAAARLLARKDAALAASVDLDWKLSGNARTDLVLLLAHAHKPLDAARVGEVAPHLAFLVEHYPKFSDDWTRSAALAIARQDPIGLYRVSAAAKTLDDLIAPVTVRAARDANGKLASRIMKELVEGDISRRPKVVKEILAGLGELAPDVRFNRDGLLALSALLTSPEVGVGVAALPLTRHLNDPDSLSGEVEELAGRLFEMSQDAEEELELRLACVETLLALPERRADGVRAAKLFLDPYFPLEVQLRVIERLGEAASAGAVEASAAATLAGAYSTLAGETRERIFHHLYQRPARLEPLFSAVEAGALTANDLGPHRRHRLEHHPDAKVAARARALFASSGGADRATLDALIADFLPAVREPGDAQRGRALFQEHCSTCHTFEGEGKEVGPELTGMGAHGAASLLPFILDPNRSVESNYLEYVVETVDERIFAGVLARETKRDILLKSSAGEELVARDEIASLRSTGRSPMPTGFESLGKDGIRDILSYLTQGYEDYRVLDLALLATSSTNHLYDVKRDAKKMRFRETGIVEVDGVPFEILDADAGSGLNALVLKGGMAPDWDSKLLMPQSVDVPVGFALERLHVLGGIAAWGYPFTQSRDDILELTWHYADGESERVVLKDGDQFSDWIRRSEVPGSLFVDVLEENSWGQVRTFTLDPSRTDVAVERIELASFDNHLAPTFLALTAQVHGASDISPVESARTLPDTVEILLVGGGSSHDYARWFGEADSHTLRGLGAIHYTELLEDVPELLPKARVLVLSTNQPIPENVRAAIFAHVDAGRGLLLLHPAAWYNWADWPEYNRELVGGGSKSHGPLGEFEVRIVDASHGITQDAPATFRIVDELYRLEADPQGSPMRVLAIGTEPDTGREFPVAWTVNREGGPIACITLGHDGRAHEHEVFQRMLREAVGWLYDQSQ